MRGVVVPVAAVLAVLGIALSSSGYVVTLIGFAAIYGVFCTGLNFFMGYTGQASFGQNAFAALGGYGSAILTANYYWDPVLALLVSLPLGILAALNENTWIDRLAMVLAMSPMVPCPRRGAKRLDRNCSATVEHAGRKRHALG